MSLQGYFYNKPVLEFNVPDKADVGTSDYSAKKVTKDGKISDAGEQRPFYIADSKGVTLKVETWGGEIVTWNFGTDGYPLPLRKIFKDAGNVITESEEAITEIQVCY